MYKGIKYSQKEIPENCRVIPKQAFTIRSLFQKSQRNQHVNIHLNKDIGIGSSNLDSFEVNPIIQVGDLTDLQAVRDYNLRKLTEFKQQQKLKENENKQQEPGAQQQQPGE